MAKTDAYKLCGYIEFVPVEGGFVTPVFKNKKTFYLEVSTNIRIDAFEKLPEAYKELINPAARGIQCSLSVGDDCWYAFKWRESVSYGSGEALAGILRKTVSPHERDYYIIHSIAKFIDKFSFSTIEKPVWSDERDTEISGGRTKLTRKGDDQLLRTIQVADEVAIVSELKMKGPQKRKAEEILFTRYSYFIREAIRKYSLSEDEAFDAYSDAIIEVIAAISTGAFEHRSSLKTYLYALFHNKAVDILRKITTNKNVTRKDLPFFEPVPADPPTDAGETAWNDLEPRTMNIMKTILNRMDKDCREILLLYADGNTDGEIADLLGHKKADAVALDRLRCINKLRILFKAN